MMHPTTYIPFIRRFSIVVCLLATLLPLPTSAAAPQKSTATTHATTSAQSQEASDYALQPVAASSQESPLAGQSYEAMNPAQALHILFNPNDLAITAAEGGELDWRLTMQLESYSRANAATAPVATASTVVSDNKILYNRELVSEWYVNGANGLKQGFTLAKPPAASSEVARLQLSLRVGGTLKPQLSLNGDAVDLVTASGAQLLRYDSLVVFDANQVILPAYLSTTATGIIINIDDSGAAYPITVDPLLTNYLVKQTAPEPAADDFLGYDVNISQEIAIVGMYGDDNANGVDAGSVILYDQLVGGFNKWGQRAILTAADGAPGDQFGKDVYVHFGITVTVGAPGDDDKGSDAGAAYLFARDFGGANAWGQLIKLTADDGAEGDEFGSAVSVQKRIAIVGAPGVDTLGNDAGAVYVFEQADTSDPTSWVQVKVLTAPDGTAGDSFGAALVNSEDLIIVGAPGDDDACPVDPECNSGAIYIFERDFGGPNNWGMRVKRTAEDASAGALFGTSLNISTERVIVGAPGDGERGAAAGAAYIFDRNLDGTNTWKARPKIMAPDGAANDQFGRSVGIGGNIAIIGAPYDDDGGTDTGSAYLVFFRGPASQGAWSQTAKVIASDGNSQDHFGLSVDQRSGHIVIGSPASDTFGAAYFYNTPFSVGTLQIASNVEPNDATTNWNYLVEGNLTHSESVVGDAQTSPALLFPGTYTITESAGANTDAGLYETKWSCTVNGASGPSGIGSTLSVFVGALQNVVCNFTHTLPGSITIVKQTKPDGGSGFSFTDNLQAPNSFTLDDNGTKTFTGIAPGTYQVTENLPADWRLVSIECVDADGGTAANGTSANIDLDAGEAITCTYTNKTKDNITVIKSADASLAVVGQTIHYTYTVVNDSPDTLTGVTAVDDKLGPLTLGKTTLASGEETVATKQYVVQASDLPGPLTNSVSVTGTPPTGPAVTDSASLSINLVGAASIAISVAANPDAASVEDVIQYSYWITNTGQTQLVNIKAMDNRLGLVPLTDGSLQPGESTSGSLLYTVLAEDLPGSLQNSVTVTGEPPLGATAEATASTSVDLVVQDASLAVNIHSSTASASVTETITYTYQITNSGASVLSNITAVDNRLGSVSLSSTTLSPGESAIGTLTYIVKESDLPGPLGNIVIATGKPVVGSEVEAQASIQVMLESEPSPKIYLPRISP